MTGILTHAGFRPAVSLGESNDGLAKTLGIERLTPAIDAIAHRGPKARMGQDARHPDHPQVALDAREGGT